MERFFGTLKEKLDRWRVDSRDQLVVALDDFRVWCDHVRPQQHLGGRTPAEAWAGIDPYADAPKTASYFSTWDGTFTGFYLLRSQMDRRVKATPTLAGCPGVVARQGGKRVSAASIHATR